MIPGTFGRIKFNSLLTIAAMCESNCQTRKTKPPADLHRRADSKSFVLNQVKVGANYNLLTVGSPPFVTQILAPSKAMHRGSNSKAKCVRIFICSRDKKWHIR